MERSDACKIQDVQKWFNVFYAYSVGYSPKEINTVFDVPTAYTHVGLSIRQSPKRPYRLCETWLALQEQTRTCLRSSYFDMRPSRIPLGPKVGAKEILAIPNLQFTHTFAPEVLIQVFDEVDIKTIRKKATGIEEHKCREDEWDCTAVDRRNAFHLLLQGAPVKYIAMILQIPKAEVYAGLSANDTQDSRVNNWICSVLAEYGVTKEQFLETCTKNREREYFLDYDLIMEISQEEPQ